MTERRKVLSAAFALAASLWSAEILLARLSSHPQPLRDMLLSLVGLTLLAVVPAAVLERVFRDSRLRSVLFAASAAVPLALVGYGIVLPLTLGYGYDRLAPLVLVGAVLGWRVLSVWRATSSVNAPLSGFLRGPFPDPATTVGFVLVCSVITWLAHMGGLPPIGLLGPFVVALLGVGLVARTLIGIGALIAVTLVVGLLPRSAVNPVWLDRPAPAESAGLPDIVFFSVDTLRRDVGEAMRSYERVAGDGVAFQNAQAAAPWTLPSMASLFTGVRPPVHGALGFAEGGSGSITPTVRTFVQILDEAGYDTAGVSTNSFLNVRRGFKRGFSTFVHAADEFTWSLPRARSNPAARPTLANLLLIAGLEGRPPLFDARVITAVATAIVDGRREDRPMLLWVHYMDCHLPYEHADSSGLPREKFLPLERGNIDLFAADPFWKTEDGFRILVRGMRNEAEGVDESISAILDSLGPVPSRGRIVVFVADHGEEFFEHEGWFHRDGIHQELVGIPLAISGLPGREPGTVERGVVGHIDVMPTLLAAAGLPDGGVSGQNLAGPITERIYVSEGLASDAPGALSAARRGRYKLLLGPEGAVRLYDLEADPGEKSPLSGHDDIISELRVGLEAGERGEARRVEVSKEEARMLEALGYAE